MTSTRHRPSTWHESVILTKQGSQVYVVDSGGHPISNGYFSIEWEGRDSFIGYDATSEQSFTVDTNQSNPFGQRLTREITLGDVVEYAADERVAAFAAYLQKYDDTAEDGRVPLGDIEF